MLNAQLLSFLRVFVDVPDHGDCLFDALIHFWNAEVGVNAPEAPWIEAAWIRGLSEEAIQGSDAHQLLRDAMVDEMQAQLRQETEATEEAIHSQRMMQKNTGRKDHGVMRTVCYL